MTGKAIEKKATELVPWKGCERPIPRFLTELPWAEDDDQAVDDIMNQILNAETVDDVLDRPQMAKFEDFIGTTFQIEDFKMRPSDLPDGVGAYAVVAVVPATTKKRVVTSTSAGGVLAQLARLHALGAFPCWVTLQEVDTGKKGRNNPLYLAKREGDF